MSKNKVALDVETFDFLIDFGLTEREVSLYTTLLNSGPNTIMNLSRLTGIKRSTTHNNVEELIGKGLISQTNFGERRMVIAESPDKLKLLMQQNKYKIEKMSEKLPNVISKIMKLIPESGIKNNIEVKYFEGLAGFKDVCERSLINSSKEVLFLSNMDEWKKVFTDKYAYEYYVPVRLQKKIFAKTLAIKTDSAMEIKNADKEFMREMRFLPKGFEFEPTLIISDSEVSIMTSSEPYTAILIQNESIAKLFRDIFYNLWEMSK